MLGRIVTILKRLVGYQSYPALEQQAPSQSSSAKPLRAKSGRPSKAAQAQSQSVKPKRKPKSSAAQSTTAVKSRKPAKKSAPAERGQTGKQSKTPARQTRRHAK